eukprot:3065013-Pyramimonas_sp.AAC.1
MFRLRSAAALGGPAPCWIGLARAAGPQSRRNRSGRKGWPAPVRDREHLHGPPRLSPTGQRKVL